ncbi:glycosyltransferase family 4 protein [Microbacterium sp.]|uniref:glycosyltransferase family 4 protein n=1 Tax=Microbacterium sp. TaxID=51671 RepID=UPI003A9015CD
MSSPKLCLLVTSSVTATTFLGGYLNDLKQDGWDVTLICSDGPGLPALIEENGVGFEALRMAREPSPLRDLVSVYQAWRLLRRLRPEVVVYATPKASLVGALAGRLAGVPRRIYELWGLRLETATGVRRKIFGALESLTARLSTSVVANSRSLADRARDLRVDGRRAIVVLGEGSSHGVDAERFHPGVRTEPLRGNDGTEVSSDRGPVIGFIGRLHPDKGLETLLEALNLVFAAGNHFQFVLVGEDEGAIDEIEIERLSQRLPVHLVGHMDDVRPALAAMDILVLPSRREGFPNVVLEAAAMQVPSIVSDATGCRDSVVDRDTGLIVPVDDAVALAGAIEELLNNEALRIRMGEDARERILADFSATEVRLAHSRFWRSECVQPSEPRA